MFVTLPSIFHAFNIDDVINKLSKSISCRVKVPGWFASVCKPLLVGGSKGEIEEKARDMHFPWAWKGWAMGMILVYTWQVWHEQWGVCYVIKYASSGKGRMEVGKECTVELGGTAGQASWKSWSSFSLFISST